MTKKGEKKEKKKEIRERGTCLMGFGDMLSLCFDTFFKSQQRTLRDKISDDRSTYQYQFVI